MKAALLVLVAVSTLAASAAPSAHAASEIPELTDIAKDVVGHAIVMDQYDAEMYCKNQGARLPTIRELAVWATQYGAKVSNAAQNGYDEIDGTDSAGKPDTFYFQYTGYHAPPGELGQHWYWSSSVIAGYYAYFLLGSDGGIDNFSRGASTYTYAVRCVRSR